MQRIITEKDLIQLDDLDESVQELICILSAGFEIDVGLAMLFFTLGFQVGEVYKGEINCSAGMQQ